MFKRTSLVWSVTEKILKGEGWVGHQKFLLVSKKYNNTQLITLFLTRSKLSLKSSVADISVNEYLKNRNWLMTFFGL